MTDNQDSMSNQDSMDNPGASGAGEPDRAVLSSGVISLIGQFMALGLIFLFFATADWYFSETPSFVTARNLRSICVQSSVVAVAALGMTIIIIAGGIDLSAGTAIALCATVLAWFLKEGYSTWVALPASILTGALCGFVNGFLVSLLRVVPFIVTLGTMTFYLGIAKLVASETTVRPEKMEQIPGWLRIFVSIRTDSLYWGLPAGVWLILFLAIFTGVLLRYTVFSRYVFALGSNESTARLCGINVPVIKMGLYSLAGLFVGLAGMYQFAKLSTGNPTSGTGLELRVIAAVVIGGGSLSGGRGSVLGTLIGAIIIYLIGNGCTKLGLSNPVEDLTLGLIIIAAVTIDQWRQRQVSAS